MDGGEKASLEQSVYLNQARLRGEYLPVVASAAIFIIHLILWLYTNLIIIIPVGIFLSILPLTIFLFQRFRRTPRCVQLFTDGIEMTFRYGHPIYISYDMILDMYPADARTNWVAGLRIKKNRVPFLIDKEIAAAINEMWFSILGKPIPYWDGIGRGFI